MFNIKLSAISAAVSQDDFPNPGATGGSNYEGYRLQLDYKVNPKVAVDLRLFSMERIEDKATLPTSISDAIFNEKDRTRLQLNLNYKFLQASCNTFHFAPHTYYPMGRYYV